LRSGSNGLVKQTITELSGGQTRTTSTQSVNWSGSNGWYMDFNPGNKSPGELVNVDPQLVLGTLVIVTAVPGGGACSVGGDGWMYQVDYETGQYITSSPGAVAGRKQQGALIVGVSIYQLGSGSIVANIRDSKATGTDKPIYTKPVDDKAKRAGWREIPSNK
jgi:type IV pilus assembly protein PilY1